MANREQGDHASGRRSSLTNYNNAEIIRRMNEVGPDQSPGSDFTTTFGQPSRNVNVTSSGSTNQTSPLTRQPSKAGRALKNIYTKAKDKTAKLVDEALLSPGHADDMYPNALAPKREVQISLPVQDETWLANFMNATTDGNAGRTLIPIENAQDLRRQKPTYAGAHWNRTNFVQDKNGVERQRLQSTKELKEGLLNGTVAYVGGRKPQPSPSSRPARPNPTAAGSSQATSSAQASSSAEPSRTLPTVPVNHSAVDAKKPAPQAKVPRRKIESTWGALINAANKSPSNSSEETLAAAPVAESSERARRRRVTVINSQAFDPVDQSGTRDSFAHVGQLAQAEPFNDDEEDEDEAFNFSSPPSPVSPHAHPTSDLADEAQRLESIDLGDRFVPSSEEPNTSLQIDTHIRDGHVSWYVRDEGAQSSRHARQHRTDGMPSPTAQSHVREEDEAAALWKRLEEQQQQGVQSLRRTRRR
ncbi:hypothetical protein AC579_1784 [Pseudocercospora musae]|uniref:Uncharacterized protein n=1 Tax=Pseudocercospora musae TaxID=113226 RepID=A0A139INS4_9PEZI|nr:hypothetical protein AC579_1784 [Pseudocercospora musae]